MQLEKRFPHKRVLITGANSGFGRAMAMHFGRKGWRVAVTGRRPDAVHAAAEDVRKAGAAEVLALTIAVAKSEDFAAAARRRSIAVLPFVNMSDDKDNEFLGDGLAEELLNLLAKVPELRVAARTSSFHFKDKDPTIAQVASALQVETVLEGSVRRSGDTIRVVAQLISASDGHIVAALLPAFTFARQEFLAITEAAPGYAPAWAWLARTWIETCECVGGDVPEDVAYARAQESIDTALRLNPREAVAVLAQGELLRRQGRDAQALIEYDRALDPLYPEVLYELAHLLKLQGRQRGAFATVEQLYEINPANARALAMHLDSDSDEIARMLYLADGVVRAGGRDFRAGGTRARRRAGRSAATTPGAGQVGTAFDAEVTTRIVLGDLAAARDLLWQMWSALEQAIAE